MAISASKVTRMGMAGDIWQPQSSYSGKTVAVVDDEEKKIGMMMMQNTRRSMNRYRTNRR